MNKKRAAMVVGGAVAVLAVGILSSDHLRVRYTLHALHRAVEDEDVARFARWADADAVAQSVTVVLPRGLPLGRGAVKVDTSRFAPQFEMRILEMVAGAAGRSEWQNRMFGTVSGRGAASRLDDLRWIDDRHALATVVHLWPDRYTARVQFALEKQGWRWRLTGIENVRELSAPIVAEQKAKTLQSNAALRARIASALDVGPPRRLDPGRIAFTVTNRGARPIESAVFQVTASEVAETAPLGGRLEPAASREMIVYDRGYPAALSIDAIFIRWEDGETIRLAEEPPRRWRASAGPGGRPLVLER